MKTISVREHPMALQRFVDYFAKCWASEQTRPIYQNCIEHTVSAVSSLPQWYLLLDSKEEILGGIGLITNDFISRMDLYPWLCALHVEEPYRKKGYGAHLVQHACLEASRLGYSDVYLCTGMLGYYEKLGVSYLGDGYHPWGSKSRIYKRDLIP